MLSSQDPAAASTAPRRWRFIAAFAIAFALLLAIAGYGLVQSRRAEDARAFQARSLAAQAAILEMENLGARMELAQRGWLITADSAAADEREAVYALGHAKAKSLVAMMAGRPAQLARARQMAMAFEYRHAVMQRTARLAIEQGLGAARLAFPLRGEGSVDPVLEALHALRDEEQRMLGRSAAHAHAQTARFERVLVAGTAAALLLLLLALGLVLHELRLNARLGNALREANALQAAEAEELARSNRELEAFSYTISHDLRAPLRHIDGYARMLEEDAGDALDPTLRRYVETISHSSRRMGALIDDLLAYSRLGRKPLEPVALDMNALTDRVLPDAGLTLSQATVDVGPLPAAHADPVLMRQAWVNLLSNALKYSAPRGPEARIEVRGERAGDRTRYIVRDNGVGFDMQHAGKLFGVFQRMHAQDDFEGTGVGLAIVQQVVQRHGGKVWADAEPGRGATFTIELPAGAEA